MDRLQRDGDRDRLLAAFDGVGVMGSGRAVQEVQAQRAGLMGAQSLAALVFLMGFQLHPPTRR